MQVITIISRYPLGKLLVLILILLDLSCSSDYKPSNSNDSSQIAHDVELSDRQILTNPNIFLAPLKKETQPRDLGLDKIQPFTNVEENNNLCGNPIPKILGELNQIDKSSSILTKTMGIDLGLWGITGALNKKDVLIISNFITYKDYNCSGINKRVSVGMQIYIHAKSRGYKIKSADIVKLAAAVELGQASADYHLHIFGLTNAQDLYKNLPPSTFDVDSYAKIESSFDGLISSLSNRVEIDPIISDVKQ